MSKRQKLFLSSSACPSPLAEDARDELRAALQDQASDVRLTAAEALCQIGVTENVLQVMRSLLTFPDGITRREALYVLVCIGEAARSLLPCLDKTLQPRLYTDLCSHDNLVYKL